MKDSLIPKIKKKMDQNELHSAQENVKTFGDLLQRSLNLGSIVQSPNTRKKKQ
jgi:hypothetical protein